MIKTKKELKKALLGIKNLYEVSFWKLLLLKLKKDEKAYIFLFLKNLYCYEYHYNNRKHLFHKILSAYYLIKKNRLGKICGFYIWPNSVGNNLYISHLSTVLINGHARIGNNCILHGNNCIGSKGYGVEAPIIGDNCEIGFGACLIGNIRLGNNIIVGANSVVIRSFEENNCVLAGNPARIIKRN